MESQVKLFVIYVDMLRFGQPIEKEAKSLYLEPADIREQWKLKFKRTLEKSIKEKRAINFKEITLDSWVIFAKTSDEAYSLLDFLPSVGVPLEIAIGFLSFTENSNLILSDTMMHFLKDDILQAYKQWFKEKHETSITSTFVVATEEAYKALGDGRCWQKPSQQARYYLYKMNSPVVDPLNHMLSQPEKVKQPLNNIDQEENLAYQIIEDKVKEIDSNTTIKSCIYDSNRELYIYYLLKNDKKCEVIFSWEFLSDLNQYNGSRTHPYWLEMERELKYKLTIPMQLSGLIPFSSNIFFEDNQEWEKDNVPEVEVSFPPDTYEIFQDGLIQLYNHLKAQQVIVQRLKLINFPYDKDMNRIKGMIEYREKEIKEKSHCTFRDRISLTSRKHLKAAALTQFISLENAMLQGNYSTSIRSEINKKVKSILKILISPVFERVKIPDYLHGYKKDTR